MLTVKNLSHHYQNAEAPLYQDVNMDFEPSTLYTIVGESGSGKTTLLSFLAGLDAPSQGEILIDGQNIAKKGLTKYRQRDVSIVFQAYNLLNYMSAVDNVLTALAVTESAHKGDRDYALAKLAELGITDQLATKNVQQLSGGQQQRVAIARALAVDAPIVLADEPTGNLDEDNTEAVLNIFDKLAHEVGKTVIIITHESQVAARADVQIKLAQRQFTVVN